MSSVPPTIGIPPPPNAGPATEVGAHGAWIKAVRRLEMPENGDEAVSAPSDITTGYAIWRMTYEGRTASTAV